MDVFTSPVPAAPASSTNRRGRRSARALAVVGIAAGSFAGLGLLGAGAANAATITPLRRRRPPRSSASSLLAMQAAMLNQTTAASSPLNSSLGAQAALMQTWMDQVGGRLSTIRYGYPKDGLGSGRGKATGESGVDEMNRLFWIAVAITPVVGLFMLVAGIGPLPLPIVVILLGFIAGMVVAKTRKRPT